MLLAVYFSNFADHIFCVDLSAIAAPTGKLKIYTYNNKVWKWNDTVCAKLQTLYHKDKFHKVGLMSSNKPLYIYIFDPDLDWISAQIVKRKAFDANIFEVMGNVVKAYRNAIFVDIGSNIGVFTLQMADLGVKVIALDASHECVQHLCASVLENDMIENVTIVHNAISSDHRNVKLVKAKHGNFGIQFIESEDTRTSMHRTLARTLYTNKTTEYKSVTLDDILDIPNIGVVRLAFIKMDVEGFEHKILKAADKFFAKVYVLGVFMEWDKHFDFESGDRIIEFFKKQNYHPYECDVGHARSSVILNTQVSCDLLVKDDLQSDIGNIMWMQSKMLTTDKG